jgi:hypothetical protein
VVVVVVLLLVLLYYCTANGSSEQIFLELLLYQIGTKRLTRVLLDWSNWSNGTYPRTRKEIKGAIYIHA